MTAAPKTRALTLPWPAIAVIAAITAAGVAVAGLATMDFVRRWPLRPAEAAVLVVFGVLWTIAWVWPLVMFQGDQSEAISLDEGFFVVLALLCPPGAVVLTVGAVTLVAQLIKRRPLAKVLFNSGQMLVSVAAAEATFVAIHGFHRPLTAMGVLAAVMGALVFVVVNSVAVASILGATGTPLRAALLDGVEIRLLVNGAGVSIALVVALVAAAYNWALPFAVLPLLVLRFVLAGHFEARSDRSRLQGLFESTLEISGSIEATWTTRSAILDSARKLLRCTDAQLSEPGAPAGPLQATLRLFDGPLVLSVEGRNRAEPFDGADRAMLEALAMVGATSLGNAALYKETRQQRERLSAITASLGEGVCAVDRLGRITFLNSAAAKMLGWDELCRPDGAWFENDLYLSVSTPSFILAHARRAIAKLDTITNEDVRFTAPNGTTHNVAVTVAPIIEGEVATGAVLTFRDITERKRFEEELARYAFYDGLTGLPNRRLFMDHLDHALIRSERSGEQHAVLFVDVDRFKVINDSLGHQSGDHLLMAIAQRLKAAVRPGDVLSRFGGDEFTLLLEGITPEDSIACAQRILDRMREPVTLPDGHEVVTSVSIGVALTGGGKTPDDVLRDADVAMYQAKARGRGACYKVFDVDAMGLRSAERIELEAGLRRALENDEFVVHFQPVVDLVECRVVGAEALVRWNHPTKGLLLPADFIGVAEDTGLIMPLGLRVLEEACTCARKWRDEYGVALDIAVNLSPYQFRESGLFESVRAILERTAVNPAQICLEITESLAMEDTERTALVFERLKGLGVRLSIDDFGTGYSALGYLASFPVDLVKVDRSFVEGIDRDPVRSAIIGAVVNLSEAIGIAAVIEGIETEGQLEHLRSLGCRRGQGFLFAKALEAGELAELLASGRRLYAPSADEPRDLGLVSGHDASEAAGEEGFTAWKVGA